MDESDMDNRVQRTADWLRRGINPNSNGTENEIAQGLQKLNQQLQQAQIGMDQGKPGAAGAGQADQSAALDQVERLRRQLDGMAPPHNNHGQPERNGQNQSEQGKQRDGQLARNGSGQPGSDLGHQSGDARDGDGRGADGTVWGNINTGNNRYGQPGHSQPQDTSGNPPDTERTYEQSMRALGNLRKMVQNDPQAAKEVEEIARQMQRLGPGRFPGNPEIVEQMHREVLSSIDRLELQLERERGSTDARTGKTDAVPPGYQESVADYYRRLSKNP